MPGVIESIYAFLAVPKNGVWQPKHCPKVKPVNITTPHLLPDNNPTNLYQPLSWLAIRPSKKNSDYQILVVDPERALRGQTRLSLKNLGYSVILAENSIAVLELVTTYRLDLVILDSTAPYIDSLTLCTAIREQSEVPIIMLTSPGNLDIAARSLQLGADGYLAKPFTLNTLKLRLQGLLDRQLMG